ncbi:cell division protein FtsQ/DivIB [Youngiibacter fragilis]|nr:FtsQ-type POTRA domain-containing protein [Youngiibacter fragilis]
MSLEEIQEKINRRKRRKRRRRMIIIIMLLLAGAAAFLTNSPMFDVTEVQVTGNSKISSELFAVEVDSLKGQNIFLFDMDMLLGILSRQPYFSSIETRRTLPGKIDIEIQEKKAEICYLKDGVTYLLERNSTLLEIGGNPSQGMTFLVDSTEVPALGERLYSEDSRKGIFVKEFRYLQERNISDTMLETIDLTDMAKIRTHYKEIDIILGYDDSLRDKLNKAINIIEGGSLQDKKGYIDLSYPEKPVVFIEPLQDTEDEVDSEGTDTEAPAD